MKHIKVTSRRKNPEFKYLDKIYVTNDHSIYVSLNTWTIVHVDKDGVSHHDTKPRKPEWFYMLRILIENNGIIVSPDHIFEETVLGEAKEKYQHDVDKKVADIYRELRRQDFFRNAVEKGLVVTKQSLKDDGKNGYILFLPQQGDNLYEDFDIDEEPLRPIFTNTIVPDVNDIIHRDLYVKQIKDAIRMGKKAICISGFGGLGKTSVAQILYREYTGKDDKTFNNVGYVSYKGDLKTSIISAMSYLYTDIDAKNKWNHLAVRLKNNKNNKLLIIDNVDRDEKSHQNPLKEQEAELFQEISGWPNLTVILTSRLEKIPGFTSYPIDTLGNDANPQPCIDLFNLYNSNFNNEIEIIKKLIKYCNYHTYAIELVAKSSKTRKSLNDFYIKFKKKGYDATNLNIRTKYKKFNNNTTAAIQIKVLFDITSRNAYDSEILESFAILPDMEHISEQEMSSWFSYNENDVTQLVEEGWMQCYRGQYYVHPLVKESVLLGYDDKKLSQSVAGRVMSHIEDGIFYLEDEEYKDISRKVRIVDSILEHVSINNEIRKGKICLDLADRARKISNRAIALRQYEEAESTFRMTEKKLSYDEKVLYWKAKYYRGYVLSYTSSKFAESEVYLKEALALSNELYNLNPSKKNTEHLATSWDHYGYVLSNSEKDKEAEECLRKGLEIRMQLEAEYPGEYKQMVAWSADNLGFLLCFREETRKEGEKLLLTALKYRKELAKGEPSSEVAWTCSNLACLYLLGGYNYEKANELMRCAVFEYQDLDQIAPETHYASMAYVYNNYGMLLLRGFDMPLEAISQLKKALRMYRKLEEEYSGFYFLETAMVCSNIANILQLNNIEGISKEIETYYEEAITILEEKCDNTAKLKENKEFAMMFADINYNYWVYMLRDRKYEDKRRQHRRGAISCWKKADALLDANISYFFENASQDEMSGSIKRNYPLVFYVQGGARKKRESVNYFV